MPFCTKCGKELAVGEVCHCREEATVPLEENTIDTVVTPSEETQATKKEDLIPETAQNMAQNVAQGAATVAQNVAQGAAVAAQNVAKGAAVGAQNIKKISSNAGDQLAIMGKGTVPIMKEVLKKPAEKISEYVTKAEEKPFAFLFLVAAIVTLLSGFFRVAGIGFHVTFGGALLTLFRGLISLCIEILMITLCTMLVGRASENERVKLRQGLAVASLYVIFTSIGTLIFSIFSLPNVAIFDILGSAISQFFEIAGLVFALYGVKTYVENENRLPYIMAILFALIVLLEHTLGVLI